MQFNNDKDREIFERILPVLVNTKDNLTSVSMFCPFCQIGEVRKNSKKWSPSQRKGYVLNNQSKGYDFAVFYCHNDQCRSRILSRGSGGLSLEVFADHILKNQVFHNCNSGSSESVNSGDNVCNKLKNRKSKESRVTVLPPSNRNQQSGLGAALDRKLKSRNRHRDNLFG